MIYKQRSICKYDKHKHIRKNSQIHYYLIKRCHIETESEFNQ